MRIIAGRLRGRRLAAPAVRTIRPTGERAREGLFNVLANLTGFEGARVVDLFAGTGALGLEALSRGAAFALFVDRAPGAVALIGRNIEALGLTGVAQILRRDVAKLGNRPAQMAAFDIAFADPPYGQALGQRAAAALLAGGWLAPGAILALEEASRSTPDAVAGYEVVARHRYGDTAFLVLRPMAAAATGER